MVHLLLSRAYLYMEEWEKAATYANHVITNGNFHLLDLNTIKTYSEEDPSIPSYINYHSYTTSSEVIWVYGNITDVTKYVYNVSVSTNDHPFFRASKELMNCFDETV